MSEFDSYPKPATVARSIDAAHILATDVAASLAVAHRGLIAAGVSRSDSLVVDVARLHMRAAALADSIAALPITHVPASA